MRINFDVQIHCSWFKHQRLKENMLIWSLRKVSMLLKFVEYLSLESLCFVSLDKSFLLHPRCLMLKFSEIWYRCAEKYFLLFIWFCIKLLPIAGLQKLGARSWACTYRAPKTLIRYTKKRAPKINSDVCFTKILWIIVKNYFIYCI